MLRIWLLDTARAAFEGASADLPLAADSLRLLVYLLLHRRRPESRRRMASTLWPDAPEDRALANLRHQLHRLQHILATGETRAFIAADRLTIHWNPTPPYWLDVEEFEALCAEVQDSKASHDAESLPRLERAIALYRGDLGRDMHDSWILAERERLGAMHRHALEQLVSLHVAAADMRAAADVAQRLLDSDPMREEAHRIAIGLHYLAGDRGQALAGFRRCRDLLEAEFSVEPMRQTIDLVEAVRSSAPALAVAELVQVDLWPGANVIAVFRPERHHNLPFHIDRFIGRKKDMARLQSHLGRARLVTLTGPGGCGKSRLALETARVLAEAPGRQALPASGTVIAGPHLPDGAWWVDLARLEEPDHVASAVASAVGVKDDGRRGTAQEVLSEALEDKDMLLVLDNCEHVLPAAATVAEGLLADCGDVKVLATSREPLRVPGEVTWPVAPLDLPAGRGVTDAKAAIRFGAVALFVDRARLADPGFLWSDQTATGVTQVCRRLAGLPLGIEVVAPLVRTLSVKELGESLGEARAPGERTAATAAGGADAGSYGLDAAMAASYAPLPDPEKALFRRLGVFRGGWDAASARAVCAGEGLDAEIVAPLLDNLATKSLVTVGGAGPDRRFGMLEPVRHYALERLAEEGELETARDRHLAAFRTVVLEAAPELGGEDQARWLGRLDTELGNLRAALAWSASAEGRGKQGVEIAGQLLWFWVVLGHLREGRRHLSRALAADSEAGEPRQRALQSAAVLADLSGDYAAAKALAEENLDLATKAGDDTGIAVSLNLLGTMSVRATDLGAAEGHYRDSVALLRRVGHLEGVASGLHNLGLVAILRGNVDQGQELLAESLAIARELGDPRSEAVSLHARGRLQVELGQREEAQESLAACRAICTDLGFRQLEAMVLADLGSLAAAAAEYDEALGHLDASLDTSRELGDEEGVATCLQRLAGLALAAGDVGRARELICDAGRCSCVLGDNRYIVTSVEAMAEVEAAGADLARAARLLSAAASYRVAVGMPLIGPRRESIERVTAAVRRSLGEAAWAGAWDAGAALDLAAAVEEGLRG